MLWSLGFYGSQKKKKSQQAVAPWLLLIVVYLPGWLWCRIPLLVEMRLVHATHHAWFHFPLRGLNTQIRTTTKYNIFCNICHRMLSDLKKKKKIKSTRTGNDAFVFREIRVLRSQITNKPTLKLQTVLLWKKPLGTFFKTCINSFQQSLHDGSVKPCTKGLE